MQKLLIGLTAFTLLLTGQNAFALDDSALLLSDTQIALVRQNCVAAQANLERIHATDGLMRVNLGQQFESIASRLMIPMNARIAANKLDGTDLLKTTTDYKKEIDTFRNRYQDYEQTITNVIQMNCADQPVGFYDGIVSARAKRALVHESIDKMQGYVKQYRDQFGVISAKILSTQNPGGQNGAQ